MNMSLKIKILFDSTKRYDGTLNWEKKFLKSIYSGLLKKKRNCKKQKKKIQAELDILAEIKRRASKKLAKQGG